MLLPRASSSGRASDERRRRIRPSAGPMIKSTMSINWIWMDDDRLIARPIPATTADGRNASCRPSSDAPRGLLLGGRAEHQPLAAMAQAQPKMQCFLAKRSDRALGQLRDLDNGSPRI